MKTYESMMERARAAKTLWSKGDELHIKQDARGYFAFIAPREEPRGAFHSRRLGESMCVEIDQFDAQRIMHEHKDTELRDCMNEIDSMRDLNSYPKELDYCDDHGLPFQREHDEPEIEVESEKAPEAALPPPAIDTPKNQEEKDIER